MRALLYQTALYMDLAHAKEGEEAERYQSYADVLTPVCKAWASDWGVQVALWCVQVYGGYGYTKDFPAEQYVRDVEIATIYEGTNGIQAMDFAGRKLLLREGAAVRELLEMVGGTCGRLEEDSRLGEAARALRGALDEIQATLGGLMKREDAIELILLNAVPLLDMFGTTMGGKLLLDQAVIARDKLASILSDAGIDASDRDARRKLLAGDPEAAFYHNKVESAIHYAHRALPNVAARAAAIRVGERSALEAEM
jgi:hypothetical protein